MQSVYAIMWFAIGYLLIARMGKENKVFYLGGGLFLLFGCWWLADAIWPAVGFFKGTLGIVFRVIAGIILVIVAVVFLRNYQKDRKAQKDADQ